MAKTTFRNSTDLRIEVDARWEPTYASLKGARIEHYMRNAAGECFGVFNGARPTNSFVKKHADRFAVSGIKFVQGLDKANREGTLVYNHAY